MLWLYLFVTVALRLFMWEDKVHFNASFVSAFLHSDNIMQTMVSIAKLTLVRLIHSIETVERKLLKSHLVFFYPQHPFVFTIYISHNGSSEAT